MQTGENIQALRAILDFIRLGSVVVLLIHFYSACHPLALQLGVTADIVDRFIFNLTIHLPFFATPASAKSSSVVLLLVSVVGAKGKKDEKMKLTPVFFTIISGVLAFYTSSFMLYVDWASTLHFQIYIAVTSAAYLSMLWGGSRLSRYIRLRCNKDIFNEKNESFPQCEDLIENEFSVNLPARYQLKGRIKDSFINLLCVFRGTLILGSPGSGKTYYFFSEIIRQHIQKGFCMFIFDIKFPDLTKMAYNHLLLSGANYQVPPQFFIINFDDLARTHRCNALPPELMLDITDATESSRTFMLALNRMWSQKIGDFFVESAINFCTAIFWFLKRYEDGRYCTLPHVIELAQIEYKQLFPVLATEPEISVLINQFISALKHGANEQLE